MDQSKNVPLLLREPKSVQHLYWLWTHLSGAIIHTRSPHGKVIHAVATRFWIYFSLFCPMSTSAFGKWLAPEIHGSHACPHKPHPCRMGTIPCLHWSLLHCKILAALQHQSEWSLLALGSTGTPAKWRDSIESILDSTVFAYYSLWQQKWVYAI